MNKDQEEGAAQNIKGRVEEAMGVLTGNKKAEGKGLKNRVVGAAKFAVGEVKHRAAKKLDR